MQHFQDGSFIYTFLQPLEPDLNYASLDLMVTKKPRKHRCNHTRGCNNLQEQVPVHLTSSVNAFMELGINIDAQLPIGDTSPTVSDRSIYLNTKQITKETEDMG